MMRQAREHREHRRDIAAIEPTLREQAGDEGGQRIRHQVATGWSEHAKRAGRQRGGGRKHRQAGDAGREIENLADRAEPRPEDETSHEHDHRLQRQRHRCERQRHADLGGCRRQCGDEEHRGDLDAARDGCRVPARREYAQQCVGSRGSHER